MKKSLLLLAGLLLAAVLLWWAEPAAILKQVKAINPVILAGLCIIQLITIALITWQWQLLAGKLGYKLTFFSVLNVILGGTFAEAITPAVKAGGEAVKVVMLNRAGLPVSTALAVVAGQKIISSAMFLVLTFSSMAWFVLAMPVEFLGVLILAFAMILAITAALVLITLRPTLLLKIPKLGNNPKIQAGISKFKSTFSQLAEDKVHITGHILLALGVWLLFAIKAYIAALALGISLSFGVMAAVTYLAYLAGMAPIPGGLGAFEGAVVILLASVGVPAFAAMALAIILRMVTYWFPFALSAVHLGTGLICPASRMSPPIK